MAEAFGIPLPPEGPSNRPRARAGPAAGDEDPARPRQGGGAGHLEARSAVYASTLEILGGGRKGEEALSEAGRRYLDSRGLDPDASGWYGFRSLEGRQDWQRLGAELPAGMPEPSSRPRPGGSRRTRAGSGTLLPSAEAFRRSSYPTGPSGQALRAEVPAAWTLPIRRTGTET
jgi:hypothetical protein